MRVAVSKPVWSVIESPLEAEACNPGERHKVPKVAARSNASSTVACVIDLQQNCHMQIVQCRMARSGLRWSLSDLARHSGVSRRTIARFELGGRVSDESLHAVRRTL